MSEGSVLKVYNKEEQAFVPITCIVDQLGSYVILDRTENKFIDLNKASDVRVDALVEDTSIKLGNENHSGKNFTMVFGDSISEVRSQHFSSDEPGLAAIWKNKLAELIVLNRLINPSVLYVWQREYYKLIAVAKCSGKLSVSALLDKKTSGKSNLDVTQVLRSLDLLKANSDSEIKISNFTFKIFYNFCNLICPRVDLDVCLSNVLSSKAMAVSKDEFKRFLASYQLKGETKTVADRLLSLYEFDKALLDKGKISIQGVFNYLISEDSKIVDNSVYSRPNNMSHPLSHYYIYSSHNTYLTGFQVYANSSVEIYRQCLLQGCRCIEIDSWDGPNFEPIITHGYAMCTSVSFKDVVKAIKESAFVTSEYPVIISIENHCSNKGQAKMAQYFKEILGDMLLADELPSYPTTDLSEFPPPEKLMRKILIKGKVRENLKRQSKCNTNAESDNATQPESTTSEYIDNQEQDGSSVSSQNPQLGKELSSKCANTAGEPNIVDADALAKAIGNAESINPMGLTEFSVDTSISLATLINYARALPMPNLSDIDGDETYIKIVSISEANSEKYTNDHPSEFVRFNWRSITRVYPKGSRIDSSNYNPMDFWNYGCQMVALNQQTPDTYSQLNYTMFRGNKGCGYLLKPKVLIDQNKYFNPSTTTAIEDVVPLRISIKVISAQFVENKSMDTAVSVETFGLPNDQYSFQVKCEKLVGENIIFEDNNLILEKVILPQHAYVRFCLFDREESCMYQRIFLIKNIKEGYRHVVMNNKHNRCSMMTSMLVFIKVDSYTPKEFQNLETSLLNPVTTDCISKFPQMKTEQEVCPLNPVNYPSLEVPTQEKALDKVHQTLLTHKTQLESSSPKVKATESLKEKERVHRSPSLKKAKVVNITSPESYLNTLKGVIKSRQNAELKELRKQQKDDMNKLMKTLAAKSINDQKSIKSDKSLNKDQKDRKLETHSKNFIKDCCAKRNNLIKEQASVYEKTLEINRFEMDKLAELFEEELVKPLLPTEHEKESSL